MISKIVIAIIAFLAIAGGIAVVVVVMNDDSDSSNTTPVTDPTEPDTPEEPVNPTEPDTPDDPVDPTDPDTPDEPVDPTEPDTPDDPVDPTDPDTPDEPVDPWDPTNPDDLEPDQPQPIEPISNVNYPREPTCQMAIERLKAGPDDYKLILSNTTNSTQVYEDYSFDVGQIILWEQYPGASSLQSQKNQIQNWYYLHEKYPNYSMWGVETVQYDTAQGQIGDCYFIAGVNALAEYPQRIEDVFATKAINQKGIYALNVYAMGIPQQVTIDGRIPFNSAGSTIFAKIGFDGSLWGPLIEKAWAKMSANYEQIVGGWMIETIMAMAGSPASLYDTQTYSSDPETAWNILNTAYQNGFILGASTAYNSAGDSQLNSYGIAYSHAYVVLGTTELKDTNGTVTHRLIEIRNPWRTETYNGSWSDTSDLWTENYMLQVDFKAINNGVFYIEDTDFVKCFEEFSISYFNNSLNHSWYLQSNETVPVADTYYGTYTFNTTQTQPVYVDVVMWGQRAYPDNCTDLAIAWVTVTDPSGTSIGSTAYYVQVGFDTIVLDDLPAGQYTIHIKVQWGNASVQVRDINIRVTANEAVEVKDSLGQTNQVTWTAHDDSEQSSHQSSDNPDLPAQYTGNETDSELLTQLDNWMNNTVLPNYPMETSAGNGGLYWSSNYIDQTFMHVGLAYMSTYPNYNLDFNIVITAGTGSRLVSTGLSTCTQETGTDTDTYRCVCQVQISTSNTNCGYLVQLADYRDQVDQQWSYSNVSSVS